MFLARRVCSLITSTSMGGIRCPFHRRKKQGPQSHAWAASGYRAREYQPHLFVEDLIALRELFLREIGHPRWAIIYGQSLGGHIVVDTLELHPGLYQGGLAECGLVDGIGIAGRDEQVVITHRLQATGESSQACAGLAGAARTHYQDALASHRQRGCINQSPAPRRRGSMTTRC